MGLLVCDNSAKECIYAGLKILFVAILLELVHSGEHANCFTASKCGDGGPEIEYPFYIRGCGRDLFGYPGFDVRCEGKRTMYRNFSIESIFYESQSFRLVSGDVINTSCPTPAYHYDPKNIFLNYTSNHATLIFFYNCTKSTSFKNPVYNLTCASSTGNYSFVALVRGEKCFSPSTGFCRWGSFMPVDLKEGRGISNLSNGDDYQKLLSYGFTLKWQLMSDNSCTRCRKSGGQCGRKKGGNFACYCSGRAYQDDCYDSKHTRSPFHNKDFWWNRKTGAIVGLSVLLIGLLSYIFYLNRRYNSLKFHLRNSSLYPSCNQDIEESNVYHEIPIFTCTELEEATNKFSSTNELGHGGFGTVYYGKLLDGREVAVKRLYDQSCRRVKQFMNEVEILTRLRHKNLVSLYGCTSCHSQELLLVYEYLSNGTVADHLHGNQQNPTSLPWHVRMSIAIETATALAYLHTSDIIHRDVKTENILLDKNYGVKVADFGLSRLFPHDVSHISTAPQGTPGYVDPEYHQFYQLTEKSDVYSFGVVLIELISSKPAVDISRERHEINLASFALDKIQKGALSELIDPTLGFETDSEIHRIIISVAELAFRCLQHEKETRPSMSEVLAELDAIARSENTANKPVNVDEGGNAPLPFPPQCDDVALLKSMLLMYSPVSVTQKWSSSSNSRSCTASTAPPGAASANSEEFSM